MKVQNVLSAMDKQGNGYFTMEDIYGFRTNYGDTYVICSDGDCLICFNDDGDVSSCWMNGFNFEMPCSDLSIFDFVKELREQKVFDAVEVITDVYLESEISVRLRVGG